MKHILHLGTIVLLFTFVFPAGLILASNSHRLQLAHVLQAIRITETGGQPNEGRDCVGDHGAALGPYQIHEDYWKDSKVPGDYQDCRDPKYAELVVLAYWKRYCPDAVSSVNVEVLARTHNGGPHGRSNPKTIPYYQKVLKNLEQDH